MERVLADAVRRCDAGEAPGCPLIEASSKADRHLRLEFVAGLAKLLLALAYRFLGAAAIIEEASRPKCCCSMIRRHGEQHLVNFGGKVGAITSRGNQTALAIDADRDDNTAASLRVIANVANDFPARQASVDREMILQPFRKGLRC